MAVVVPEGARLRLELFGQALVLDQQGAAAVCWRSVPAAGSWSAIEMLRAAAGLSTPANAA
jgi:hypothetical protein